MLIVKSLVRVVINCNSNTAILVTIGVDIKWWTEINNSILQTTAIMSSFSLSMILIEQITARFMRRDAFYCKYVFNTFNATCWCDGKAMMEVQGSRIKQCHLPLPRISLFFFPRHTFEKSQCIRHKFENLLPHSITPTSLDKIRKKLLSASDLGQGFFDFSATLISCKVYTEI